MHKDFNLNSKILLLFFVQVIVLSAANNSECPERSPPEVLEPGRNCRKPCTNDTECRATLKTCNCDGECGMSCFNLLSECVHLPPIDNGAIIYPDGNYYGKKAEHSCQDGFDLVGNSNRYCRSDKLWNGTEPVCKRKPCPEATWPDNSYPNTFRDEPYLPSESVTFVCNYGFYKVGNSEIHCLPTSEWSPVEFTCEILSCGHPSLPSHGFVVEDNFDFGSYISYGCEAGYTMEGRNQRICGAEGAWLGEIPECRVVKCPSPTSIENAKPLSSQSSYTYRDMVNYKCLPGYELSTNEWPMCSEYGNWTHVPQCLVRTCPVISVKHGNVENPSISDYVYGDKVSITCNNGYTMKGQNTMTCNLFRQWSNKPTCEKICHEHEPEIRSTFGTSKRCFRFYGCYPSKDVLKRGWIPKTDISDEYVEINFNRQETLSRLETTKKHCKKIKLTYRNKHGEFVEYPEILSTNDGLIKKTFDSDEITTSSIRIHPIAFHKYPWVRLELFVC